ncbi:MAG: glycosyltransferase family 2 protein [Candidatus Bathyarchaeia archaeon]
MISVIMPAYNEEAVIEDSIRAVSDVLQTLNMNYEIIVVDDGSCDGTFRKASNCVKIGNSVKVIRHFRNLGKGAAIKTGFSHSRGDIIIFFDSDLEISPKNLRNYIEMLRDDVDIIIGSKWHPNSKIKVPLLRKLLSKGYYLLARLLVGIKVSDTQVGLKVFRREVLEKIMMVQFVNGFAFDIELLAIAALLKAKVIELPIEMQLNSTFKFSEIWRMLLDLLRIVCRLKVTRWYQRSLGM